jgi:hypothetical protein
MINIRRILMKTSLDGMFKMDAKESEEGKWFPITDGVSLKIRSSFSDKSADVRRRIESGYKGKLSPKLKEQITLRHISEGIIIDWKGLEIDGEPAGEYDPVKMEAMLQNMPELISTISEICTSTQSFQDSETEKN